ncbi:hypothetical protein OCGS_1864 [Oceaniovalibus guishaninsula JLT2003]|uniref:Purine nucleoside phosphorylase n=1 Tax=Oceaniovalibus guishaninsula JLT2003 TaxID=1231392 RepID=K2H8G4_9RHOB|nr:peptidoglycan editing factor PgeF [Oceaniovalibus guishaninsula]EKE43883.1 hypothetical protein OCGS_1864 [Oceaniovalibus guishaninsula JLT2003]
MTLEILTADTLSPFRHGFFTRKGGASSGVFTGLNCGRGSTDQADVVAINRSRAAAALGIDKDALMGVTQVHSADAVVVDRFTAETMSADAVVTSDPAIAVAVLTADCLPILMGDPQARVVAAVHAGWRGALAGVTDAALAAMERLGARRERTLAVIGPAISQAAYEVGPELFDAFTAEDGDNARFFAQGKGDRLQFDLPAYGLHRLRAAGIGGAEWTRHCTYRDPARFFSYRRSVHDKQADYGRLLSAIRA